MHSTAQPPRSHRAATAQPPRSRRVATVQPPHVCPNLKQTLNCVGELKPSPNSKEWVTSRRDLMLPGSPAGCRGTTAADHLGSKPDRLPCLRSPPGPRRVAPQHPRSAVAVHHFLCPWKEERSRRQTRSRSSLIYQGFIKKNNKITGFFIIPQGIFGHRLSD